MRAALCAGTVVLAIAAASAGGATTGAPARCVAEVAASGEPVATTVGIRTVMFVDHSRKAIYHGGVITPRRLVTQIRYPAIGTKVTDDVPDAPVLPATAPYPLIVFGPGFAETPAIYYRLLDAWARAGYIVAGVSFPLTTIHVPGGRRRNFDLINQPRDMSFVISSMLDDNRDPESFLHGLINDREIAVAGQSDGAATALAVAEDPRFADPRIRAAVVLSGAELDQIDDHIQFASTGPALLAVQGTSDLINEPSATYRYFASAPEPKVLLRLLGAGHLPPYTAQAPYLGVVERVTAAFLDHYLLDEPGSLTRMADCGAESGTATLTMAEPPGSAPPGR